MTNAQSKPAITAQAPGAIAPLGPDEADGSWPSALARQAAWGVGPEQIEEVEAVVQGTIPAWLNGTLVFNGGGDYSKMRHMFDGYGFLSRLRIEDGRAWGSQRYVQSKAYQAYKAQGRVVLNEFATPPQGMLAYAQQMLAPFGALLSRRFPLTPMTDNACVSIHAVGPAAAHSISNGATCSSNSKAASSGLDPADQVQLLAITEDPWGSYMVDPETLETLEQVVYPDKVPAIMQSPHPAVLSDGSMVNFSRVFPFGGSHLYRQDRVTLERKEVAYIPDRHWLTPSWMHDFACTDKYAVLLEQPLYMDFLAMVTGWDNDAVWMRWRPEEGTRLHLITLDGSQPVRTFTTPGFCFVHVGNAFESEGGTTLDIDLGVFDSANILNKLKMASLRQGSEEGSDITVCQYMRLSLPLSESDPDAAEGSSSLPGPVPLVPNAAAKHVDFVDFPTINPNNKGKPYRYAYMACAVRPTNIGNGLAKLDIQTGDVKTWHMPGAITGEPQFIPQPGGVKEDDGVVLSPCVGPDGKAFVLLMNASSWEELARAELPYSTPYRFHGVWLVGRA